ncbi:MAG: 2-oxoglutarate oxidoreductase [Bacteroidales bacterium]|jgi:2-oxoglutarate ferredoxin oxidoreductase subunit beta|nr:2-oxoglutarate oxidoreductase [Bacteroidales bacterium]
MSNIATKENLVYAKTKLMTDKTLSYCPGCGHGVVHRVIMEVIDEMGLQDKTIGIAPVGCSVLAYDFMDIDMQQAAHGRAPALATAIKRLYPEKTVFTYQGDGDLAAIGTAETIHACNRGENIVMFFVNNGIYGMTGGQMAPTTLDGMKSATSPYGRDPHTMGHPIKITEMVAQLPAVYMVARHSVHTPANVRKFKKAVRQAFENQLTSRGTSLLEIVSNCNSGWKMTPNEANKWMEANMFPIFPLGDIKMNGELVK